MARVEIIMYIALGFAAAALIALLLGRLVWGLGVSVGKRRAQRTAPPAVAELQVERNRLRAEYAMLSRRVEVRLADLKMQLAERMAEVARNRNRIDRLAGEIGQRDAGLAERDSEIARLHEQIAVLESELTARTGTLHSLQDEHREASEAQAALVRELETLRQQVGERDRYIERLRAEVDRLAMANSAAASRERTVQERLKGRIEDLSELSRQIEAQRRQLLVRQSQSQAQREAMAEPRQAEHGPGSAETETDDAAQREHQVENAERQASEMQAELDRLDEMWAAKLADVARAVASEPAGPQAPQAAQSGDAAAGVNGSAGHPVTGDAGRAATAQQDPTDEPADLVVPAVEEKKNVISLAQRIRALQGNGS